MIDIIVPTYNRPKDIEKFVSEIQKQRLKDFHVYIVDDCGQLPVEHLIPREGHFTYIRLPENKGQAYARNIGIDQGSGDIIVSLDDDAWFEHEDGLANIPAYFQSYPKLGCLMFDVHTPQDEYISKAHNIATDGQLIGSHITCGCAYSRKALKSIDGFGGYLHSGAEETDVSLKLLTEGYEIRLATNIPVFHNYLPGVRPAAWYRMLRFNTTRNDLLIVVMRYPSRQVVPYFLGKYLSHVLFSFRNKRDPFMAGLYTLMAMPAALLMLPKALNHRKPLPNNRFSEWLKMRW